jgi:hypothetical protein
MKLYVVLLLLTTTSCLAQFAPTKAQHSHLAAQKAKGFVLQEKLQRLQTELLKLQAEQAFVADQLQQECRQIVVANRWPETVQCNLQSLTFGEPPTQAQQQRHGPLGAPEMKRDEPKP